MSKRTRLLVGLAVLAVFGSLAFLNFNRTLAQYVPFAEARASSRVVQISGFPDHVNAKYNPESGEFSFAMDDGEGDRMMVSYAGVKPGNFDQAERVVVVGRYDGEVLNAKQILVKCPSKYDDLAAEDMYGEDTPHERPATTGQAGN